MFLDDGLGGCSNFDDAVNLSKEIQTSLQDFGFLIAHDKCVWEPSQVVQWLGFKWFMTTGMLHATDVRIERVETALGSLIKQIDRDKNRTVSARFLASVVGQIISLLHAVGKIARLRTRALYRCIDTRASWNAPVLIDEAAYKEINFWNNEVKNLNDKGFNVEYKDEYEIEAFSDASADGYGGYVSLCAGALAEGTEVIGSWNQEEAQQSSTWREAEAVQRVLKTNVEILQNNKVKWFTDNQNVKRIIKSGSKKPDLHCIALNIHEACEKKGIDIQPEWIKRMDNVKADTLGRTKDSDDWQIHVKIFNNLNVYSRKKETHHVTFSFFFRK